MSSLLCTFPFALFDSNSSNHDQGEAEGCSGDLRAPPLPIVPRSWIERFSTDGFVVLPNVISRRAVDALNDRLEDVLRGDYDRGIPPDKAPRLLKSVKPQPLKVKR